MTLCQQQQSFVDSFFIGTLPDDPCTEKYLSTSGHPFHLSWEESCDGHWVDGSDGSILGHGGSSDHSQVIPKTDRSGSAPVQEAPKSACCGSQSPEDLKTGAVKTLDTVKSDGSGSNRPQDSPKNAGCDCGPSPGNHKMLRSDAFKTFNMFKTDSTGSAQSQKILKSAASESNHSKAIPRSDDSGSSDSQKTPGMAGSASSQSQDNLKTFKTDPVKTLTLKADDSGISHAQEAPKTSGYDRSQSPEMSQNVCSGSTQSQEAPKTACNDTTPPGLEFQKAATVGGDSCQSPESPKTSMLAPRQFTAYWPIPRYTPTSGKSENSHTQKTRKTLQTAAVQPQLLRFAAPQDARPGQSVCVSGPQGPLVVPLPDDVQPGERCTARLAPPVNCLVTVPSHAGPGQKIEVCGPQGVMVRVTVPHSKKAGDTFEVFPSVLMVHVPEGASPGDVVVFDSPDGLQQLCTKVPGVDALVLGTYFPATLKK